MLDSPRAGRPRIKQPVPGLSYHEGDASRSVASVQPVAAAFPANDREEV